MFNFTRNCFPKASPSPYFTFLPSTLEGPNATEKVSLWFALRFSSLCVLKNKSFKWWRPTCECLFLCDLCFLCQRFSPLFFFSQVLVLALSLSSMIQLEFIFKYAWSKDWYLSINNLAIPQSPYLFIGMSACTLNQLHSCLTLHNSVDCSLSGSSVHGTFQARIPEWLPCPPSGDLPDPGIEPRSLMAPALASRLFTTSATWEAHLLASDQIRSDQSLSRVRLFAYG